MSRLNHTEKSTIHPQAQRMIRKGRRPLIFANTEKEAVRILEALPAARRWQGQLKEQEKVKKDQARPAAREGAALVVTINAAAQGLNLQHEADCIICRPQVWAKSTHITHERAQYCKRDLLAALICGRSPADHRTNPHTRVERDLEMEDMPDEGLGFRV